ncbi:DctP family TRAP transporter solute-binding subunit [Salsuginibacillus kocurii]|uniref:DctP family TRAP transporter solute-binding subunit n=1 Tax=Salsuginibacillus kocurii TaxID=427078 RepID=UPI00037138C8|nr:DctP family TRAP transporter solute-binding subunit [Salsuginibacillus kocurii]
MKKWKKSLFGASTAVFAAAALTACGGNGDEEAGDDDGDNGDDGAEVEHEWDFITEETPGQVQHEYGLEFAERLEEKSEGSIEVNVHEFGGLGDEVDQLEQLQTGQVEMGIVSPGFTGPIVPEAQVFSLHYLFPNDQETVQEILTESEAINEHLRSNYEEQGFTPLSFWTEGAMAWTSNTELTSPDDFDGFLMRTQESPLMLESYEAYGANPTPMSWGDLYTGLEQGQVEGQENPIFFIEDASFHEVQDYLIISDHNNYVATTSVNNDWFDSLDEDLQEMIEETVEEMQDVAFELQEELNESHLEEIEENEEYPTEVIELSEEERDEFRELAEPVREFFREEEGDDAGMILDMLEEEIEEMS